MKKKIYIKTNLIIFIFAHILTLSVGVYAAVTFPSNEVSYSNSSSGLNSNNVQGAIDELYETCTAEPSAGEQIIEDAGLEKDSYECRYFFTGKNPNNYITFNDEKAIWRIISVECDGTIKIIRRAGIGDEVWDSTNNNNWARPASLNTYLNETYLKNTLTQTAQSQIVTKDWSIGGISFTDTSLSSTIADENSSKWNGKIALPTASEYIRSNSNKSSCGSMQQLQYSTSCKNTTWMYQANHIWWTLSPLDSDSSTMFRVLMNGDVGTAGSGSANYIIPSLYLSSEVKITGGTGTKADPFTIQ